LPDDGDVWIHTVHGDIAEMLEKQGRPGDAIAEWRALERAEAAGDFEIENARANIERLQKSLSLTAPHD
jgi:hypothetical protein